MAGKTTAAASSTGNPYVTGAAIAADVIGAGLSGQDSPALGNLHLVNPAQQALYNATARGLLNGAGDFGYGSNIKQGKSQLQDLMASRGVKIDPGNAAYAGAYGNMVGQAAGMDAQARRQFTLGLLGTPLQIAQTAGANFIPGTASMGPTTQAQANQFSKFNQTGYAPGGFGQKGADRSGYGYLGTNDPEWNPSGGMSLRQKYGSMFA